MDLVGKQFGNYRLLRLLGRGGFADVYLGKHLYLDSDAADSAIKILQERLSDKGYRDFVSEARILIELSHPHIIRMRDFGVEQAHPFLVMEYAPHGTLRQHLPHDTQIDLLTVITTIKQIASALQYAHNHKIIHRDLKPSNILLGRHQELLVSDFGIARIVSTTRPTTAQMEKHIAGTALYMAPEQFQGKAVFASDQYSLAIMAYEWLCGRRPFAGSFVELFSLHQLVPPVPPRSYNPSIPPEVEHVILQALAKDPAQRFPSIEAFAAAFEEAAHPPLLDPVADASSSSAPLSPLIVAAIETRIPPPPLVATPALETSVTLDNTTQPPVADSAAPSSVEQSVPSRDVQTDNQSVGDHSNSPAAPTLPERDLITSGKKAQLVFSPSSPVLRRSTFLMPQWRIFLAILAVFLLASALVATFISFNVMQTSGTADATTSQSSTLTSSPPARETSTSTSTSKESTGNGTTPSTQPTTQPPAQSTQPATVLPPTPTPTPHPCLGRVLPSNPIYQGNGYAFSNGGTFVAASAYCGGRAYYVFTEAPPVANTQVRLCLSSSSSCGGWVRFTSVGSKLLIARGMTKGATFHLQFQGYGATGSYNVYGTLYY